MVQRKRGYSGKIKKDLSEYSDYDFFKAVRMLDSLNQDSADTGTASHPLLESIRFLQKGSLKFNPQDIEKCLYDSDTDSIKVLTNCFGLFGANGPMPLIFSEYLYNFKQNNTELGKFLDIFHHRMISFFYRAWSINNQSVSYESNHDHFLEYFYSLMGSNYNSIKKTSALPPNSKLFFAGHLIRNYKNVETVSSILKSYFQIPVEVEENIPRWIHSSSDEHFAIGKKTNPSQLGINTSLGKRFWDSSLSFRIVLGPMSYNKYVKLLPGTKGYARLQEWVDACSPTEVDSELQFVMKASDTPKFKKGSLLGYTSWLYSQKPNNDLRNLIIK